MDSALVVLDKWSSYGGGRLNRFDFRKNTWKNIEKICSKLKSELLILGKYIFRNKIKKPLFKTFFFFFFSDKCKMRKEYFKFGDVKMEKEQFHSSKSSISINGVDNYNITKSNKFSCRKKGFKYFIGYKNVEKIILLCALLPKVSRNLRNFSNAKTMSFFGKR